MFSLIPRRRYEPAVPADFEWVDRFVNEMMPLAWREQEGWFPSVDISETEDKIIVKADLPGIDPKELDINVVGNVLTVRGEKKEEHEETKEHMHRVERRFGSFSRSFALPSEVKTEGIDATYKDGVLFLTIPKSESAKQKKIEVKTH